ncbi:MAG TPA: biosynthetic-type acetolactate synthase large subunit [Clostridiales bacterium]|nr:biosynthetic-type acetolactate synthase large subunit [Clostridiales bacterium]
MKMTGAEIIVESLIEQGVTDLFGYPGGATLHIHDALYSRRDRITHYLPADERGAAHAADGYARATGKVGVCLATSGPGATNLITGIATAFLDSVPMVAITANVGTDLIGKDSFQEVYISGIAGPIAKHTYAVRDINRLSQTLRAAFEIANSGRKGPVLVDIPKDLTAALCEFEPRQVPEPVPAETPDPVQIKAIAAMIKQSRCPVLCFGGGVVSSGASEEMKQFIEKTGIPTCHTIMATGVIAFGDELDLGMTGMHGSLAANTAIAHADLLIAAGTRLSDRVAQGRKTFAPKAQIIQFDIDPSEIGKSVDSGGSLIGDLRSILQALMPLVKNIDRPEWMADIRRWKDKDYFPNNSGDKLMPHQIMEVIGEQAGPESIITTDVGQHQIWAAQYCKTTRPRGFMTSGGLGTMGFGYGAAVGAQVAFPSANVIHITGDGSLHMNMCEAATAVSYGLPIITIILDNAVLGMVRQLQWAYHKERYMATEPYRKTDYEMVGKGFGVQTYRADTVEAFRDVFSRALKNTGPSWIVCPIDKKEKVLPMMPAGKGVEDIILTQEEGGL